MGKNEVTSAFGILLEEIEGVINELTNESEQAIKNKDYKKAKKIIEDAERLTAFKEKIEELQKEWNNIYSGRFTEKIQRRRVLNRLKKGLRTPEAAFRIPILESLLELGGRAKMKEVLKKVEEKMKDKLNSYDMEGLPSNPSQRRWENTAQWCRNTMVKEGLLSSNSPRGIWEITQEGEKYFKKMRINL